MTAGTRNGYPGCSAHPKPEDIALRAEERLTNSSYFALRKVSCTHKGNALTLHGRVTSFYLKQLAQELVRNVDGVEKIVNELEVPRGRMTSHSL